MELALKGDTMGHYDFAARLKKTIESMEHLAGLSPDTVMMNMKNYVSYDEVRHRQITLDNELLHRDSTKEELDQICEMAWYCNQYHPICDYNRRRGLCATQFDTNAAHLQGHTILASAYWSCKRVSLVDEMVIRDINCVVHEINKCINGSFPTGWKAAYLIHVPYGQHEICALLMNLEFVPLSIKIRFSTTSCMTIQVGEKEYCFSNDPTFSGTYRWSSCCVKEGHRTRSMKGDDVKAVLELLTTSKLI